MRRSCSSSGSSSSRSASRSSSIASASCLRCASGRVRTTLATSLGCMSRRLAASTAIGAPPLNRVGHVVPVDEAEGRPASQRVAAARAARGRPPSTSSVPSVDGAQGDVADRLVADLAVEDVLADQQLAGRLLERMQVEVPAAQPRAVAVDVAMRAALTKMRRRWLVATKPTHPWCRTGVRGHDHDVLDATDRRPAGVEQRQPHHPKRVDEIASHPRRVPARPARTAATNPAASASRGRCAERAGDFSVSPEAFRSALALLDRVVEDQAGGETVVPLAQCVGQTVPRRLGGEDARGGRR